MEDQVSPDRGGQGVRTGCPPKSGQADRGGHPSIEGVPLSGPDGR